MSQALIIPGTKIDLSHLRNEIDRDTEARLCATQGQCRISTMYEGSRPRKEKAGVIGDRGFAEHYSIPWTNAPWAPEDKRHAPRDQPKLDFPGVNVKATDHADRNVLLLAPRDWNWPVPPPWYVMVITDIDHYIAYIMGRIQGKVMHDLPIEKFEPTGNDAKQLPIEDLLDLPDTWPWED